MRQAAETKGFFGHKIMGKKCKKKKKKSFDRKYEMCFMQLEGMNAVLWHLNYDGLNKFQTILMRSNLININDDFKYILMCLDIEGS